MARTKEFDRDEVLAKAIKVFASHGYEGSSTGALLRGMGISRQSLYDTFGDKRRLYLEALQAYSNSSVAEIIESLRSAASPLRGLEAALLGLALRPAVTPEDHCLGVSAVSEFGCSDPEVTAVNEAAGATLLRAFEAIITRGVAAGELAADLDVPGAAHFMAATLAGLKLSARAGTPSDTLRTIVRMALRSLT